eukprot:364709-Chlamydomonas_euryale.AAC.22
MAAAAAAACETARDGAVTVAWLDCGSSHSAALLSAYADFESLSTAGRVAFAMHMDAGRRGSGGAGALAALPEG